MCGRYSLTTAPEALRRLFKFENLPNLAPRYNVAPTQTVPVLRRHADGTRSLDMLRWGLIPHWAKESSIASRMINARSETVAHKPAFRDAFRHRRCVVPVDGFYEWREEEGKKQPFRIGMKGGGPFGLAGLWERWVVPEDAEEKDFSAGEAVESFTIMTITANERIEAIHPRMPVILHEYDFEGWLDAEANDADAARSLLRIYPGDQMAFYRVNRHVNNARFDDPACIEPLKKSA